MSVTVGRIEYVVGADGRVLEKESRDAARKAGKRSGKVYSDDFAQSAREQFGKSGGFDKVVGAYNQKVIAQFRRLGGFSSKAYATRFEQVLRPMYQKSAQRMVEHFNKLTFGGTQLDVSKIFTGGPQLEKQLRDTVAIFDELDFARRAGLAGPDALEGLDVGALNKFRAAITDTIDAADWDLVGRKQLELNSALNDGVEAMEKQVAVIERRRKAVEKGQTEESKAWLEINQFIEGVNKALDEGTGISHGRVTDSKALAAAARENVAAENERIAAEIRGNRIAIDRHNQSKKQLDITGDLDRAVRHQVQAEVLLAEVESEHVVQLDHMAIAQRALNNMSAEQLQQLEQEIDLEDQLGGVEEKLVRVREDHTEQIDAQARATAILNQLDEEGLGNLREALGLHRQNAAVQNEVAAATDKLAVATDKAAAASKKAGTAAAGAAGKVKDLSGGFRDGDRDARLFGGALDFLGDKISSFGTRSDLNPRAIAGIIAVLGEPIAALGAALGPALVVAGAGAAALAVGVGGLIPVFSVLNSKIEDLPPDLRAVAKQFTGLKAVLKSTKFDIARAAFAEMGDTFTIMGKSVKELTPLFKQLGTVTGRLFDDFAKNTAPGTRAFNDIQELIRFSIPLFDKLARVAGKFGGALLTAFRRAEPLTSGFVDWLDRLVSSFDAFVTDSSGGFDEWLRHASAVFSSLDRLLGATGTMLDNLVTDESVDRLTHFVDGLAEFMPHLEDLISIFGELDVLGLLVDALNDISTALEPLVDPLKHFAESLHDVFESGIDQMADIFGNIAEKLAPFVEQISNFMDEHPEEIAGILVGITAAIVGMKVISTVSGIFDTFITTMRTTAREAPGWKASIAGAAAGIIAAFVLTPEDEITLQTYGTNITTALTLGLLGSGGNPFVAVVAVLAAFAVTAMQDAFGEDGYALGEAFGSEGTGNWIDTAVVGWDKSLHAFQDGVQSFTGDVSLGWQGFLQDIQTNTQTKSGEISLGWLGFLQGLQTNVQTYSQLISVRWDATLQGLKADVERWWAGTILGWTTFWGNVAVNITNGWSRITSTFNISLAVLSGLWSGFWGGLLGPVVTAVLGVKSWLDKITGWISNAISAISSFLGFSKSAGTGPGGGGGGGGAAAGTILYGPRRILAGEAGPEAIVPLRRSLSMVDPSVRALSAIAQNKSIPHFAGGGLTGGTSRVLNISPGAIVIQGSLSPEATATHTVNRIAERIGG